MYIDNSSTTLTPQDANSFAVLFNLTESAAQAINISANLQKNWGEYGAASPELPGNISPFIGSFEVGVASTFPNHQLLTFLFTATSAL
jgi:hypothetical protein